MERLGGERHGAHWGVPDTIDEMGGRGGRRTSATLAFGAATVTLLGCSSAGHVAVTQAGTTRNDMVACASVDAVDGLISRHETVPEKIAQRVIISSESADSSRLEAQARALRGDVNKSDDAGVNKEMSVLGATCNSLGVGPEKY
jgi:hypothetical protein